MVVKVKRHHHWLLGGDEMWTLISNINVLKRTKHPFVRHFQFSKIKSKWEPTEILEFLPNLAGENVKTILVPCCQRISNYSCIWWRTQTVMCWPQRTLFKHLSTSKDRGLFKQDLSTTRQFKVLNMRHKRH